VNSSNSSSTSISCTPASSDRAAETEAGQLSQVTPPLLFIIPATAILTFVNFESISSALAVCTKNNKTTKDLLSIHMSLDLNISPVRLIAVVTTGSSKENNIFFVLVLEAIINVY